MTYDVASTVTTVSPAKTGDAREAITVRFVADEARLDSPIASCPDPLLPQGFAYGEGKAAKGTMSRAPVARRPFTTMLEPGGFSTCLHIRRDRGVATFKQTMKPAQPAGVG